MHARKIWYLIGSIFEKLGTIGKKNHFDTDRTAEGIGLESAYKCNTNAP